MSDESAVTKITGQPALRQFTSADGHEVVSIIQVGDNLFRAVHDTEVYEPGDDVVPPYWYWTETRRSGLFESVDAAMKEALATVPWLRRV